MVIFLLFLVIMMSLYLGSQRYNGFAFAKSSLSEYPYEGFAQYQETFESREGLDISKNYIDLSTNNSSPSGNNSSPFQFGPLPKNFDPKPSIPTIPVPKPKSSNWPFSSNNRDGFETMTEPTASKLSGSTYGDEKPVAFLYNNDANTTCKNYGYTNSKGFICMSASDIQLLTTRGGNAAGTSDQIGK